MAVPKASGAADWFPDRERVVWDWPVLEDLVQEEEE